MGLLDIIKGKKQRRVEERLRRPSKGADFKPIERKKAEIVPKKEKAGGAKEKESEFASEVILSPHITEKATTLSDSGVYVFKVRPTANKVSVGRSVKELYGLKPRKIRIVNVPSKLRFRQRKAGVRPGYKKALVYLKEGESIDIT